jgi:hypothetical protein
LFGLRNGTTPNLQLNRKLAIASPHRNQASYIGNALCRNANTEKDLP